MNLKPFLSRLLPEPWRQTILLNRQRRSLEQLPPAICHTHNLLELSAFLDYDIFNSGVNSPDWQRASTRLSRFEIPDMTGGVNPGDRRAIFYLTCGLGVKSVLEIGTHIGASTCHFAAALEHQGESNDLAANPVRLVSVDRVDVNHQELKPWLDHGSKQSPKSMITELGCEHFVEFQTGKSLEFLKSHRDSYDLIFLDGDHSATTTYQEIPAAMQLLNPGGVILLHDFFPELKPLWSNGSVIPGPLLAASRLADENNRIEVVPLGDLPWPTKLGSRKTSLALVLQNKPETRSPAH
ncbi:MAG: class I SAM-dependent methyltransferase [Planctomycetota bacterium]|nr:class I SAM-dependent methyltransferase [Planctomycetota bacterium]